MQKCIERCPIDHYFCNVEKACILSWQKCGNDHLQVTLLNKMFSSNKSSEIFSINTLLPNRRVSFVHRHEPNEQQGTWQYKYNNRWHNLNDLPEELAVTIDSNSQFRYHQHKADYGIRILYYFEDESNSVVGSRKKPQPKDQIKAAILLIHPIPISSDVTVHETRKVYQLREDDYDNKGISIFDFIHIHTPVEMHKEYPIPEYLSQYLPAREMESFDRDLSLFHNSRPFIKVKTDFERFGELWEYLDGKIMYKIKDTISVDFQNARLFFRPKWNYNGNFSIDFQVSNPFLLSSNSNKNLFSLAIQVAPVNDPPSFTTWTPNFPAIGYNLTDEPNIGFTVEEFLQANGVYDVETGSDVGIAVYRTPHSTAIGYWKYYLNETWVNLTVVNKIDMFNLHSRGDNENSTVNVHLLVGKQRLKFELNRDTHWDYITAVKDSSLGFSYWDQFDGLDLGKEFQKQPPDVFCKKSVLKNFAMFTGKHLYRSLFSIKLQAFSFATLFKKRLQYRYFLVNIAKNTFLRTPILRNICKRLLLKFNVNIKLGDLCSRHF